MHDLTCNNPIEVYGCVRETWGGERDRERMEWRHMGFIHILHVKTTTVAVAVALLSNAPNVLFWMHFLFVLYTTRTIAYVCVCGRVFVFVEKQFYSIRCRLFVCFVHFCCCCCCVFALFIFHLQPQSTPLQCFKFCQVIIVVSEVVMAMMVCCTQTHIRRIRCRRADSRRLSLLLFFSVSLFRLARWSLSFQFYFFHSIHFSISVEAIVDKLFSGRTECNKHRDLGLTIGFNNNIQVFFMCFERMRMSALMHITHTLKHAHTSHV